MAQKVWIGYRSPEGIFVEAEDAFAYALQRCGLSQTPAFSARRNKEHREFREMLLEWFYDGMWDKVYEEAGDEGEEARQWRAS